MISLANSLSIEIICILRLEGSLHKANNSILFIENIGHGGYNILHIKLTQDCA